MFSHGQIPSTIDRLWPWLRETFQSLKAQVNGYSTASKDLIIHSLSSGDLILGNAESDYLLHIDEGIVEIWFRATFGSTTTFPATDWYIDAPRTPKIHGSVGELFLYDASTDTAISGALICYRDGSSKDRIFFYRENAAGANVKATVPFTWTLSDGVYGHIRYPI